VDGKPTYQPKPEKATAQVIVLQIRRVIVLEMRDKFVKAVLITAGGYFLFPLALEGGLWGLKILAALLLIWLLWAVYRLIRLARVGAYRRGAPAWDREDFGFAAGIVCASVGMRLFWLSCRSSRLMKKRSLVASSPLLSTILKHIEPMLGRIRQLKRD
jgi:hypothetical protein